MAMQRSRWKPDTCGCEVVYEWDDTQPLETRDHVPVDLTPCPHHQGEAGEPAATKAARVFTENRTKNAAVAALVAAEADLKPEDVGFRFDDSRKLVLRVPNLAGRKTRVTAALAASLGAGRVGIE